MGRSKRAREELWGKVSFLRSSLMSRLAPVPRTQRENGGRTGTGKRKETTGDLARSYPLFSITESEEVRGTWHAGCGISNTKSNFAVRACA